MKFQRIAALCVWLLALSKCAAAEPFLTIDGYDGLGTGQHIVFVTGEEYYRSEEGMSMFAKIMKDGALSLKEKEFIALGIGVALRCEPCIRIHTQKCLDVGATKEQILEAASVAVMMGGGPAYTHIPMVIETLEALQG